MGPLFNTNKIHSLPDVNTRQLRHSKSTVVQKYRTTIERLFIEYDMYKKVDTRVHMFKNFKSDKPPSLISQLSILDNKKIALCVLLRQYAATTTYKKHMHDPHA